jgi:redox-sensitive bicupin YhaK (pirin superfamily)
MRTKAGCGGPKRDDAKEAQVSDIIRDTVRLDFRWPTQDPFLVCVHHVDRYPAGNDALGPQASLAGRTIGQDFAHKDGWNMYHGEAVPGFPAHPHRGFETVTIVQQGYIDHADSLGAVARDGMGDVQWLTTGSGVEHSEKFPLRNADRPNPTELFQIWLNLPARSKHVPADFTMFWRERIPQRTLTDGRGASTRIEVVAGRYDGAEALAPPAASWAADPTHDVAIWLLELDPGASFLMPAAHAGTGRALYFYEGERARIGEQAVDASTGLFLRPDVAFDIDNGNAPARFLLLQGKRIGEPVVQHGPFVMNSAQEIRETLVDYQRTGFGGWPWGRRDPVFERTRGRFAQHPDGRTEEAPAT